MAKHKFYFVSRLLCLFCVFLPYSEAFAKKCKYLPKSPKPDWVSSSIADSPQYYYGIGAAERQKRSFEEMRQAAKSNALAELSNSIQVSVRSAVQLKEQASSDGLSSSEITSMVNTTAEQTLSDLQVEASWLDRKSCVLWVRVSVPVEKVRAEQSKQLNNARYIALNNALDKIRDGSTSSAERASSLAKAKSTLAQIDFSVLESVESEAYFRRLLEKMESQSLSGKTVALACVQRISGVDEPWHKACSELETLLQESGANVSLFDVAELDQLKQTKASMLIIASGKVDTRDSKSSAFPTDYRFNGQVVTTLSLGSEGFKDSFSGLTGWSPVSQQMTMDVLALNITKRVRQRLIKFQSGK